MDIEEQSFDAINGVLFDMVIIETDEDGEQHLMAIPAGSRVNISIDKSLPSLVTSDDEAEAMNFLEALCNE